MKPRDPLMFTTQAFHLIAVALLACRLAAHRRNQSRSDEGAALQSPAAHSNLTLNKKQQLLRRL